MLDYADGRNIGFSKFISFGNKADVNEIDLLRYLKDDPDTDVILMYLEDITNGREFLDMATEITWETPISPSSPWNRRRGHAGRPLPAGPHD